MWQIIKFFVLLWSYPDDDRKSDGNMLVINNMWWNIFLYIYICWFHYVSEISS